MNDRQESTQAVAKLYINSHYIDTHRYIYSYFLSKTLILIFFKCVERNITLQVIQFRLPATFLLLAVSTGESSACERQLKKKEENMAAL